MMSATRTQRVIAFILLISPWLYIPTIFKEIIFILLAGLLYLSTIELRKKHKDTFESEAEPAVTPIVTNTVA